MAIVADAKQLALLKHSVGEWNQWRRDNIAIEIDFVDADLENTNLDGANLSGVYLTAANLRDASLRNVCFEGAILVCTDFSGANLYGASLRDTKSSGALFCEADLSGVDFDSADLSSAIFWKAKLGGANFSCAHVLGARFENANLTAACIQDWNINSDTSFNGVICDYIYLKGDNRLMLRVGHYRDRHPRDPNRSFAPGDFARLSQKARETVDLIFREGIDWRSFADTLQEVRKEQLILKPDNPNANIAVRAIETRDDGSFVIRVSVPDSLDKAKLEAQFQQRYALKEQEYQAQLQIQAAELNSLTRENTRLDRIVDSLLKQQEATIAKLQGGDTYNIQDSSIGSAGNKGIEGKVIGANQSGQINNITPSDEK